MSTQALSTSPLPPRALITRGILRDALIESFVKLLPQQQWKNPVMFIVYVGSIPTTVLWFQALAAR
jgi:K+-transporting ATPase ATPase B chain